MKTILFFLISCLSFASCSNAQNTKTEAEECSSMYPFKYQTINLENNLIVKVIPKENFKTCSKFAHRFLNPISDSIFLNGKSYVIEKNKEKKLYVMHIYQNNKIINTIKLPVQNPLPEVHEYYIHLLPYQNTVIMMMEDMYTTHYKICKYNADGKELMSKDIEHTFITHPEPKTNYHHRYLYFNNLTATQMIFTSHISSTEKAKTIVLSMNDFTTTEYDQTANGIILDENEANLAGFATLVKNSFTVQMIKTNKKYEFEIKNGDPACEFILKNNLLYIANYHPISTGSSLHCFDLQTGKMKWTADVKQVNASHSEYSNKVILSMYKNKIVMEGIEESGHYVQLFDSETGMRLAAFGSFMDLDK